MSVIDHSFVARCKPAADVSVRAACLRSNRVAGQFARGAARSLRGLHSQLARNRYDDGRFSGGNLERPAAQRLLTDIRAGRIDIVVVYKVRLTRSLADFARLIELFDAQGVSFVSVTQQINRSVQHSPAGPRSARQCSGD
jgi:DNA invertase Pin-like site-specific DNA recombinase